MNSHRRSTPRSVRYIALRSVPKPRPLWEELLEIAGAALTVILIATTFIVALPTLAMAVTPR